jgi:hypothetical protein
MPLLLPRLSEGLGYNGLSHRARVGTRRRHRRGMEHLATNGVAGAARYGHDGQVPTRRPPARVRSVEAGNEARGVLRRGPCYVRRSPAVAPARSPRPRLNSAACHDALVCDRSRPGRSPRSRGTRAGPAGPPGTAGRRRSVRLTGAHGGRPMPGDRGADPPRRRPRRGRRAGRVDLALDGAPHTARRKPSARRTRRVGRSRCTRSVPPRWTSCWTRTRRRQARPGRIRGINPGRPARQTSSYTRGRYEIPHRREGPAKRGCDLRRAYPRRQHIGEFRPVDCF